MEDFKYETQKQIETKKGGTYYVSQSGSGDGSDDSQPCTITGAIIEIDDDTATIELLEDITADATISDGDITIQGSGSITGTVTVTGAKHLYIRFWSARL